MANEMESTVPRRRLGRALRQLRIEANMTLEGAAQALQRNPQKMRRIETGTSAARQLDVRAMCELYGASPELTGALTALAAETNAKGWWHSYGGSIPHWFNLYAGLESAASRLREYNDGLIPQLLHTRGYALGVTPTRPDMAAETREHQIEVRLRRQTLLQRRLPPPPQLDVMLSEAALLRVVGDPTTMAEQLRHLLDMIRLPNVSIRILPLAADLHVGAIAGSFVMLDFPPGHRGEPEPSVVYRELLTGALYLDRKEELAAFERVWSSLNTLALDEEQSTRLINKLAAEFSRN